MDVIIYISQVREWKDHSAEAWETRSQTPVSSHPELMSPTVVLTPASLLALGLWDYHLLIMLPCPPFTLSCLLPEGLWSEKQLIGPGPVHMSFLHALAKPAQ